METKTRFRIYTEHCNIHLVQPILDHYFENYTLFHGMDINAGEHERCLIIEAFSLSGAGEEKAIMDVCREINRANHKAHCRITSEQVDVMVVSDKLPIM